MEIQMDLKPLNLQGIECKRPLLITGPCSAESEEQVLCTAKQLAAKGMKIFRAGVWKPRTKPNTFEGYGVEALPWLAEAREVTGLPITTEVANAKHVEEASLYDLDIYWVGARTVSNPFSMQEVAEALRGTDKMVYVKNPVSADIDLWAGGVERLLACGIKNIGLIHRGFSGYGAGDLRNAPMWHLALEMRRRMPDLPMICDPSHICGSRQYIQDIAQQAADLGYDGFMIESHICPEKALSDSKQQLTPEDFAKVIESIKWRAEASNSESDVTPDTFPALESSVFLQAVAPTPITITESNDNRSIVETLKSIPFYIYYGQIYKFFLVIAKKRLGLSNKSIEQSPLLKSSITRLLWRCTS